jgi:hypothetical protein
MLLRPFNETKKGQTDILSEDKRGNTVGRIKNHWKDLQGVGLKLERGFNWIHVEAERVSTNEYARCQSKNAEEDQAFVVNGHFIHCALPVVHDLLNAQHQVLACTSDRVITSHNKSQHGTTRHNAAQRLSTWHSKTRHGIPLPH